MKLFGIPLRGKSEARTIALDKEKLKFIRKRDGEEDHSVTLRKIRYKKDFFSAWSAEMAYVLGVIYTDGNIHREKTSKRQRKSIGRLRLAQKEPELLEKVLSLMKCNAKIFFVNEKRFGNVVSGARYQFDIANDELYDGLLKYGLTPRKSLILTFPDVPREYVRHFIRGCWDGDGAVYLEKQSNRVKASYVSGSKRFMEGMVDALREDGFAIKTIYVHKREPPSYYFRLNIGQMRAFYHYLYDDVPE